MIEPTNIEEIFSDLDAELTRLGKRSATWRLVVCGGGALISLGIRTSSTLDIDVLEPDLDDVFMQAAATVAKKYGLLPDWINNGPKSLVTLLPSGWDTRLSSVFSGESLNVYALGRSELLISKVFAEADRQEDLEDIVAIRPSRAELDAAGELVAEFDANPGWPAHVRRTIERIWTAITRS